MSRLEQWVEAIQPELRALPSPAAGEALLERIIASRADGARVILPTVDDPPRRSWVRAMVVAVMIAALLVLALPFVRGPRSPDDGSERLATSWISPPIAFAQSQHASVPVAPRMSFANAARLRARTLEYRRVWQDSAGRNVARTTNIVTLAPTVSAGVPAWLLVSRHTGVREGRPLLAVDSVTVTREDLRPLRRAILMAPYGRYDEIRVTQQFRGDSVLGAMHATGARIAPAQRPIARLLPPESRPYVVDAFSAVLLEPISLQPGWRGAGTLVSWAVRDDDVRYPVEFSVVGEEVVAVPAGRFDCWRVEVHFPGRALVLWSRKSDRVVVRSLETDPGGARREAVLVRSK